SPVEVGDGNLPRRARHPDQLKALADRYRIGSPIDRVLKAIGTLPAYLVVQHDVAPLRRLAGVRRREHVQAGRGRVDSGALALERGEAGEDVGIESGPTERARHQD